MTTSSEGATKVQEAGASWKAAEKKPSRRYEGPVAPIVASILGIMAWCIFILFYALYWSLGFNWFQNLIVTVVSLVVTGLAIGLMWVLLGPRQYWRTGLY